MFRYIAEMDAREKERFLSLIAKHYNVVVQRLTHSENGSETILTVRLTSKPDTTKAKQETS